MDFEEYLNFSDWTFYLLLFLWIVVLWFGLKYFYKIEKLFKLKDDFQNGSKTAVGLLQGSFIFGFIIYLIWVLAPDFGQSKTLEFIIYSGILLVFLWHVFISFKHYKMPGAILRMMLISVLMIVYFYSGWVGGLLMIAVFAVAIIVFALFKLKKILTIG
ncbi:MAG: hypothetical protein DRI89_06035 [Bacteroidetes bacterium]|nr:MAG: hypothetical protein DRI89_06035 [Bacteroidota bacterium]